MIEEVARLKRNGYIVVVDDYNRDYGMATVLHGGGKVEHLPLNEIELIQPILNPDKKDRCCFCGQPYGKWGNNPEPIVSESHGYRCCDACNANIVVPARMIRWSTN